MSHDRPSPDALARLYGRSFLLTQDASMEDLEALLGLASQFEAWDRAGHRLDLLPDSLATALFFDKSTRTRTAWAGAAARLGMAPLILDGGTTQVAHGETAEETGAMIGMNSHAIGVRHDLLPGMGQRFMRDVKKGIDEYLIVSGEERKVPVVNLQCDLDHPTQTLADLMWLRENFPEGLEGRKIGVSWAFSQSYAKPMSVPQGIVSLLTRFGCHVVLAHPEGYGLRPDVLSTATRNAQASGGSFVVTDRMDDAFDGALAVYPKSWGPPDLLAERVDASQRGDGQAMKEIERRALQRNSLHEGWICDATRMASTAGGDALYLHCLPADIGAEVAPEVMTRHKFNVALQAQKKLYVIMAMLAAGAVKDLPARLERIGR